jgi:formyltetrahydrofolate synthetase
MIGKPFIVLGSNGMLAKLKELGYRTFNKWFDETYDNTDTLEEKIKIIIKNLNSYKNKSIEELQYIRNDMKSVCEYNQLHFQFLFKKNYYDGDTYISGNSCCASKPVLDALLNIYNS